MPKYKHILRVEGEGRFPFDMLRYDACYPNTTEDAVALVQATPGSKYSLCLTKVTDTPVGFTPSRWISFGCRILHNTRIKL